MKILLIREKKTVEKQKLNFFGSTLCHIEARASPTYFVIRYLWKHIFASNLRQIH